MGLGSIISSMILIIATLFVITLITYNSISWINYIYSLSLNSAKEIRNQMNSAMKIISAYYLLEENKIIINITNAGSSSIILGRKTDIVVDYIDSNGSRRLELLVFGDWYPIRLYINNYTVSISDISFVEIPPGIICEIAFSTSNPIDPNYPVIIVLITPSGVRAEYVFLPRG